MDNNKELEPSICCVAPSLSRCCGGTWDLETPLLSLETKASFLGHQKRGPRTLPRLRRNSFLRYLACKTRDARERHKGDNRFSLDCSTQARKRTKKRRERKRRISQAFCKGESLQDPTTRQDVGMLSSSSANMEAKPR